VDPSAGIFLVHGHDRTRLAEVARFIERVTDQDVVILHEQPNTGQTLLEKFETNAARAAHAVVLLTADDVGRSVAAHPTQERPRGRQNVVLELGFFFGKLGRSHVTVLKDPEIEDPSDIHGLVYVPFDQDWKLTLGRELRASGITVDLTNSP
jgi:predicted nucleotide-binding protein